MVAVIAGSVALGLVLSGAFSQEAPPYLQPIHEYPDVVALVNGDSITGDDLARMELAQQEQAQNLPLPAAQATGTDRDALEVLIDELLLKQAAERLGLAASHDEAIEYTRNIEEQLANLPAEERERLEAVLRAQGLPTEDFASNEVLVEGYGQALTMAKMRTFVAQTAADDLGIPFAEVSPDQAQEALEAFLLRQREMADIQILVPR